LGDAIMGSLLKSKTTIQNIAGILRAFVTIKQMFLNKPVD